MKKMCYCKISQVDNRQHMCQPEVYSVMTTDNMSNIPKCLCCNFGKVKHKEQKEDKFHDPYRLKMLKSFEFSSRKIWDLII